jgi:glycosyl transferase family 87
MRRRLPAIALAGSLVAHAIVAAISFVRAPRPAGDFDRYYEIASSPGRPYVDYQVEHPIGTLLLFKALARLPGGRASFGRGVVALDILGDVLIVSLLVWSCGVTAAACYAASILPVLGLLFNRVDAWSTAAATAATASWRRNRAWLPGVALGVGAAFKLWPLVLVPLLVVPRGRGAPVRARRPAVVAFLVVLAALGGLALAIAGGSSVLDVITFRGARGWQIESVVGNLVQLSGSQTLRLESGAWRVGSTSGPIAIAMFLTAAPICIWSTWRGARTGRVGTGWLAAVSSLLVLAPLLSAQYVIWLTPAAGLAWTEGDRRSGLLASAAVILTQTFYAMYDDLTAYRTPVLLLVLLRNVVLVALAVTAIGRLKRGDVFADGRVR